MQFKKCEKIYFQFPVGAYIFDKSKILTAFGAYNFDKTKVLSALADEAILSKTQLLRADPENSVRGCPDVSFLVINVFHRGPY